jgi:hypothetical protein
LERPLPPGVDILYYEIPEKEPDVSQLRSRLDLFTAVLRQLCQIGSASADNPFPAPSNSAKPE